MRFLQQVHNQPFLQLPTCPMHCKEFTLNIHQSACYHLSCKPPPANLILGTSHPKLWLQMCCCNVMHPSVTPPLTETKYACPQVWSSIHLLQPCVHERPRLQKNIYPSCFCAGQNVLCSFHHAPAAGASWVYTLVPFCNCAGHSIPSTCLHAQI